MGSRSGNELVGKPVVSMRNGEIAIVAALLIAGLYGTATPRPNARFVYVCCAVALVALVVHGFGEGMHWQMVPAYLGVGLLGGLCISWQFGRLGAMATVVFAIASCGLAAVLPMFKLPAPTGPFSIGTEMLQLVDPDRVEQGADGSPRSREFMVQLWYPAEDARGALAPYRRRSETTMLSSYQSVLWTHSHWGAGIAKGPNAFPVLLFNPAWNGRRTQNTFLVEELASHGFVVAGIDHTGNSGPTAFSDGRVTQPTPVSDMDFASNTIDVIEAAASRELERQVADNTFTLDRLQTMSHDPKSRFYRRLDTNAAGALGHSFGGAVAAQASYLDPRIRCALDLDGSLFGEVRWKGLRKPFMFIEEDVEIHSAAARQRMTPAERIDEQLNESDGVMFSRSIGYRIFLHGSTHPSFTDKALFSPIQALSGAGRIPAHREFQIIRQYALAFFDSALRGRSSPLLLAASAQFPEVTVVAAASVGKSE